MPKNRYLFWILLLLFISSCKSRNTTVWNQIDYTNSVYVNNETLKKELISYVDSVKLHKVPANIIIAYLSVLNDSTTRFEVTYDYSANRFKSNPFLFTSKIKDRTIFFCLKENIVLENGKSTSLFSNDSSIIENIMKEHLPKEYEEVENYKKAGVLERDYIIDDGDNILDLTFVKNKLVRKQMRNGYIKGIN